ncbi:unnamed protein product [Alopecurus aequalis]
MAASLSFNPSTSITTSLHHPQKKIQAMASELLLLLLVPPVGLLAALAFLARPRAARTPLRGRHVFITGGSSGIGLALATTAARGGARVSILARNASRLEDARAAIGARRRGPARLPGLLLHLRPPPPPPGCPRPASSSAAVTAPVPVPGLLLLLVRSPADVRAAAAVARALQEAGPIDVLVFNHGVFVPRELELQDVEEVMWMVDINLIGTFHLIKAALPAMKVRARDTGLPASIAIMLSQAGQVGVYGYTAYSASKFTLTRLAGSLQHEVISDNVHVSLIFPQTRRHRVLLRVCVSLF